MSSDLKNKALKFSIEELVNEIIEKRSFQLRKNECSFDEKILIENDIIKPQNDHYDILVSHLLTEALYQEFKVRFKFKLTNNFKDYEVFFEKVENYLKEGQNFFLHGGRGQLESFLSNLIIRANKGKSIDFYQYSLSISKDSKNFFLNSFNVSFSDSLRHLKIPQKELFEILKHFHSLTRSDADINVNAGRLSNGIRFYCESNFESGKKLLTSFLRSGKGDYVNIVTAILVGLYHYDRFFGYKKFKELARDKRTQISVICAIANIHPEREEEISKLLDIVNQIETKDVSTLVNKPKVYCHFLEEGNETCNRACKTKLIKLITIDEIPVKQQVLQELLYLDGFDEIKYEILLALTNKEIPEELFNLTGNIFAGINSIKHFFDFLIIFGSTNKFQFTSESFSSPIYILKQKHPEDFSKRLIELLIHDEGFIRDIGHSILAKFSYRVDNSYFVFDYDILKLSAVDQYKLWISLLQNPPEPKRLLPAIFPLRNSSYGFVKEAFICKIEELIEDYSYSVIEVYESIMNKKSKNDRDLLARLKNKFEEIASVWDKRDKLKELDPRYTQSKLHRLYMEQFTNSLNESMKGVMDGREGSLLNLFTTVNLAKGGGWKHAEKNEVTQLGSIATGIQFPNNYYKSPNTFNWERLVEKNENWNNKLNGWEAIISS